PAAPDLRPPAQPGRRPWARLRARRLRRRDGEPDRELHEHLRLARPAWLRRRRDTRRHRGKRLPGPAGRLGRPLTGPARGAAAPAIPGLSDKDLTVKV